jgi:choline dehydrogenase
MYDYIVVGAGSAGCVVANRLSASGATVLLLEAGGAGKEPDILSPALAESLTDSSVDWGFRTVPQTALYHRRLIFPRGKCLGGSSAINYMVYMRGNRGDYDHWAQLGNRGWGYDDVLPLFVRSEGNTRFRDRYHGSSGPLVVSDPAERSPLTEVFLDACRDVGMTPTDDVNGAVQEGYGHFQATVDRAGRCSTARAFLDPITDRKNLRIRTRATATRLLLARDRATGIEYLHEGRLVREDAAREIVLCGGAINSPQLLMLSGIGPPRHLRDLGIDVTADLPGVGENLHDHLCLFVFGEPADGAMGRVEPRDPSHATDGFPSNHVEAGAFFRCDSGSEFPDIQLHFMILSDGAGRRDRAPAKEPGIWFFLNRCRPRSRGHLRLNSSDPLDRPLIDPGYLTDSHDLDVSLGGLRQAIAMLDTPSFKTARIVRTAPLPGADSSEALIDYVRRTAESINHPVGTCKMGSDRLAVVDDRLRVHGIDGLRVADASIMPDIVSGNTNAPCIMIGEKASDLILGL